MAKKGLSKGAIAGIVVAAVLAIILIAGGIYCGVTDQSPASAVQSVVSKNDEKILGIWESDDHPGLFAYQFYDDGTCDYYISTVPNECNYEVKGNKLIISNPVSKKDLVYKMSVNDKVLKLTLLEEDEKEPEEKQVTTFTKVKELRQKSLTDLIGEYAKANQEETTEAE